MKKTYKKKQNIYWLDGFSGGCRGGCYIRSDLNKLISNFKNIKVVGIILRGSDEKNIELIIEDK